MRRAIAATALVVLSACAGIGARGREALDAVVVRSDAAEAGARTAALVTERPHDPWARLGAALLARRALDPAAEADHLLALAVHAPAHPLALFALRRLGDLTEESPAIARAVEAGLTAPLAAGKLTGLAAYRARVARIAAAEVLGDHPRAASVRAENGAVTAWTLAGPFGVRRALDFVRAYPPDGGVLPDSAPAPLGGAPRPTRTLRAPDGSFALDGEPGGADVFYLAADVTLARGGRYLLTVGTAMSARVQVDGALAYERREFAAHLPTVTHVPLSLGSGIHRLLVKVARAADHRALHVALAREDGTPSDATWSSPAPGAPLATSTAPAIGPPVHGARAMAAALEREAGRGVGSLLAAMDAAPVDREGAKMLFADAAAALPRSAAVRVARAALIESDPTLDEQVATSRAEGELREAIRRDPDHPAARVALAAILRRTGRLDDADEILDAVRGPAGASAVPGAGPHHAPAGAVLLEIAMIADARGLTERAEALVAQALANGGGCRALELGRDLAGRRQAIAVEDERVRAASECRGGRERLSDHLRRRGDLEGAIDALLPFTRARPWAIEPTLALAALHLASGAPARAAEVLEAARAIWPRSARLEKALADARELAGDPGAARAARERALLLDGGDLALRRALALEDGREVLDAWAEDATSAIRAYEAAQRVDDTSSALVLDAAAVELHPGGALTERTHQVIHVLDQEGVEQFGEVTLPPGAQLLALRTVKPDGRAIEPEREPTAKGSISLAGLEAGDYVRIEYLRSVRADSDGAAADPFFFRADGSRLFRSTYVVAAPPGLGVEVDAHRIGVAAPVRDGAREVIQVTARDVPAHVPEPNEPSHTELFPYVQVGIGSSRDDVHQDLADAAAGRARSTEELRAFARLVRADAGEGATPAALARAAWARVAREIPGSGGAFGDEASEVLSRGRGSRLTVLRAVLSELGIRVRVAVARPFGADPSPRRFPSHTTWFHPLLRIELGREIVWHDPFYRHGPLGTLPSPVLGAEALVLGEPGEPLQVDRVPERAAIEERRELAMRIVLRSDGSASVEGEDRYHGAAAAAVKASVEQLDGAERRQAIEGMLARTFPGLSLSSGEIHGEDDPAAPFVVRWRGTVASLARVAAGRLVVDTALAPARLGARFVQLAARTTPLLIPLGEVVDTRVEVVAPEGFVPEPAAACSEEGEFGTFACSERVEGASLVREERLVLRRGRVAPERYPEFASFAAAVDRLQERPMALVPRSADHVDGAAGSASTK